MQVVLVMFRPGHERRSFSLPRQTTVIGRKEDCDLRIPLAEVSRKHCRFVVEGESLRLEDLGSSNGTYVNGKRIQEAIIKPGDNVQIGPLTFVVQIDGQPPDEEIPEPVAFDLADSGVAAAAGKAAAGDSAFDLDLDFLEEEPKKQTQE